MYNLHISMFTNKWRITFYWETIVTGTRVPIRRFSSISVQVATQNFGFILTFIPRDSHGQDN